MEELVRRRGPRKPRGLKQVGLGAKHDLKALDCMLEYGAGYTDGVATFRREVVSRPLEVTEQRYYVPVESLGQAMQRSSPGRKRRACIVDTVTKRTRLEILWSSPRPSLHFCIDQCHTSFNNKKPLLSVSDGQISGTVEADVAHRWHNNHGLALCRSGLKETKHQIHITCIVNKAPFGGNGFFDELKSAAEELFANFDTSWPWFGENYNRLAHQMHRGRVPEEALGTPDHTQQVWSWCENAPVVTSMASIVKAARWYALMGTSVPRLRYGAVLDMVGSYIGCVKGWKTSSVSGGGENWRCESPLF